MQKTTVVLAFFWSLTLGGCDRELFQFSPGPVKQEEPVVPGTEAAAEPRFGPKGVTPVEEGGLHEGKQAPRETGANLEACLDRWLAEKGLDPYGNEKGTAYAGGTPLFDERTGETTPRADYVFAKHPGAKAACSAAR